MTAETFQWSDDFLIGYSPMDNVHHEFVELVNDLLTCDDNEIPARLQRFAEHADQHFSEEQRLMEATDFPPRHCHIDDHSAVLRSVAEVTELVAAGQLGIARALARALADWFPEHASHMDAGLAQWVVKQQTGGSPIVLRRRGAAAGACGADGPSPQCS